jgi:arsenite methyltransferase
MYDYFEIQAKVGITKHMGGLKATRELLEMCRVDDSDYVLVVGSGNGVSAIKIHRMTGCSVVGIDISEDMVERAREKLETGVEFIVSDAENINFPHNTFDIVISESVTAFTDKMRSISEYHRVLKNRGYLGLNEITWMINPPLEVKEYYQRFMGLKAETKEGWLSYIDGASFKDIKNSVSAVSQWKQVAGDLEMQSMDFFRIWTRFFQLYLNDREYRRSIHQLARDVLRMPHEFSHYFGYGLYVGKK